MSALLKSALSARIRASGPITVAEYMREALLHPAFGYYAVREPFGLEGDFITAPEISQMFGELIGLSLAQSWIDQGAPKPFTLAELGPGRGTLMADLLRATRQVPGFHEAMQLCLVEASPLLRAKQCQTLDTVTFTHLDDVAALPQAPLFLVANEFFDALPISQFIRDGGAWRERLVGLDGDTLQFGLGPPMPRVEVEHRLSDTADGDLVEYCSAASAIISEIGARIAQHGGGALIIDYGDWRSLGDTLQAVSKQAYSEPLEEPGMADLTAHVDFEHLAHSATPARHTKLATQGVFLERLGITQRARALADNLSGDALETHIKAHQRLTHPAQMGSLFKVLGLYPDGAGAPPGLEK